LSPAQVCNRLRDTNRVGQNIASRNTLHGDALRRQPAIAFGIEQGPVASFVHETVHLDSHARRRAPEIEDIAPHRMLATNAKARLPPAQRLPQQDFGKRHRAPQGAGALDGAGHWGRMRGR
jgi:hypothetical protein